ncbi:type II secretion system F family protein [Coraliomargarita parva]|uniref:type II secretion system F family protein n=1 Tax=Coraliomargarita parva TaxID=3014050 RepID=UPI0022B38AD1|nr:type II secretion system F family protein [Coraliomargarita parva]
MPQFVYKARENSGQIKSGVIEALDRRQATQRLQSQGAMPITVEEVKSQKSLALRKLKDTLSSFGSKPGAEASSASASRSGGRPRKESSGLALLKRLLELHSSGLPVGDSIRILSQRLSNTELKNLAGDLWRDLSEGATLALALTRQPKYFSNSITYVIEAGEATGNLAPILRKVIDYLEEKQAIKKKMLASMAYPAFILAVAGIVIVLFLTVLLPKIQEMLARLGGEMTLSARILIEGSALMIRYGPILAIALIVGFIGLGQWRRSAKGRLLTDRWLLRVPLIGKITLLSDLFQSGSLVSTLLESGINTTETLNLTEKTIQNLELRERFHTARVQVNEGLSISQAFKRNHFMPDLALDILSVGENTGNLAHSMHEVTKSFREELTQRLLQLTAFVTTGTLFGAFALVALIAIGIVTSIFQVSQTL